MRWSDSNRSHVRSARIVAKQIEHAIYPFHPGLVDIYVLQDPLDSIVIKVTCSTMVDDVAVIDGQGLYLITDEDEAAIWVGAKAGIYFDSLRNEPIPDTIILGEN